MRSSPLRSALAVLALGAPPLAAGCASPPAVAPSSFDSSVPIALTVDATGTAQAITHAHVNIPARPGAMTLAFPKWIPGQHRPVGPLVDLVALRVSAGGKSLAWQRDPENLHEVTITVPAGAAAVEVDFDMLDVASPATPSGIASTPRLLDLHWNRVLVYPKGLAVSAIRVTPRIALPPGWQFATALPKDTEATSARATTVDFRTVSVETLVDSPLIAGAHFRTYDLGTQRGAAHSLSIVGDSPESIVAPPEMVDKWRRMVAEANALFGARHYDSYKFLVTASDAVDSGLEHHASSEEGFKEKGFGDEDRVRAFPDFLPHEYAHSWDGKFRRPRGLATPDYQAPMHGDLLWVYEGLTEYLGQVLAARSGLASMGDARQTLANTLAAVDSPGREWRPLVDTATSVSLLYGAPAKGWARRRSADYYMEGALIWLEADVLIRQKTNGARSLDDFCQRFFGGRDTGAEVRPYDLDEVIATLNGVVANDWRSFFTTRVYQVAPRLPVAGIEGAGYKVIFTDKKPELNAVRERAYEYESYGYSLGFGLNDEHNIPEVIPGSAADKAGLVGGTKLVAVDGRKYSTQVMKDALARAKTSNAPIELLVDAGDFYRTVKVDWHGGERYMTLERAPGRPDLLEKIFAPRVPAMVKAGAK